MQTASKAESQAIVVDWTPELDPRAEEIVGAVFDEYGFGFYPDGYDSDLRSIESSYIETGGMFRFLLIDRHAVGTVAARKLTDDECELKRMYLLSAHRGRGYGGCLIDEVVTWAGEHGFRSIVAWSDTRFEDAHAAYRSRGFEQFATRPEPGPDPAEEYGFRLILET